jgi:hypothetical protein
MQASESSCHSSLGYNPIVGPPSVVGGDRNILACGAASLAAAHQNVVTALSLKSKAGMSCQRTTGRKPGGSQCRCPDTPTDSTRHRCASPRHEDHGSNQFHPTNYPSTTIHYQPCRTVLPGLLLRDNCQQTLLHLHSIHSSVVSGSVHPTRLPRDIYGLPVVSRFPPAAHSHSTSLGKRVIGAKGMH